MPVAIEFHGSYSKTTKDFISELGRLITAVTSDRRESSFLFQRISVAIQRFNTVCVFETFIEQDADIWMATVI